MEAGPPDKRHISHGVQKSVVRKNHMAGEELDLGEWDECKCE